MDAVQCKLSAQQQHLHTQAKEERNRLQQQVQAALMHVSHSSNHSPCALNVCATICPMSGLLNGLPVAPQHTISCARSSSAIVRHFRRVHVMHKTFSVTDSVCVTHTPSVPVSSWVEKGLAAGASPRTSASAI